MDQKKQARSNWTYQRLSQSEGIESSYWNGGSSPLLSPHFHSETQVSIVYSGCRYFFIGGQEFRVTAGHFVIIPARLPHKSIRVGHLPTRSRDVFVVCDSLPEVAANEITIGKLATAYQKNDWTVLSCLLESATRVEKYRLAMVSDDCLPGHIVRAVCSTDVKVADLACEVDLSREGFIRRFAREMGMTPHAYRVAHKTDFARRLLRSDMAPAEVAAEVGFSDQSHMGRFFLKKFGTTPAAYKRIWRR